jgi:sterol desaturase/sphingolipid hydroxylase (fatty acid hydroxylase superfamily)
VFFPGWILLTGMVKWLPVSSHQSELFMPGFDPQAIRFLIFLAGVIAFWLAELIIPYRRPSVSKFKRLLTNMGIAALNTIILRLVTATFIVETALFVTEHEMGVLHLTQMPYWVRVAVAVVFLDFMLYIWHLLLHVMPFLWRFHRVHHSDLNMDVTTASRFHIGELFISSIITIAIIFFLGADLFSVVLFEALLMACSQFEHSSIKVPERFEKRFWTLFVPPSMHRIHHSVVIGERNTNYGTIFSIWDRMSGTLKTDVDQDGISIGIGAYNTRPEKSNFLGMLIMPFTKAVR